MIILIERLKIVTYSRENRRVSRTETKYEHGFHKKGMLHVVGLQAKIESNTPQS